MPGHVGAGGGGGGGGAIARRPRTAGAIQRATRGNRLEAGDAPPSKVGTGGGVFVAVGLGVNVAVRDGVKVRVKVLV